MTKSVGYKDAARNQEILGLYLTGIPLGEIAKAHNISHERVRQILITSGKYQRRYRHGPKAKRSNDLPLTPEQRNEIGRRYSRGQNVKAIAKEFGVAEGSIWWIAEHAGYKRNAGPLAMQAFQEKLKKGFKND